MKALIIGKNGQLGREFTRQSAAKNLDYAALGHSELPIENLDAVMKKIREIRPDLIINCAAYNQVDLAEKDFIPAWKTNALGPYNLALAAVETGARLVHYSTDYVFDGQKTGSPYTESDEPNPVSKYAESKLAGEEFVRGVLPDALILRVSWVYGDGKQNFIHKVQQWLDKNPVVKVATDEVSVPTSTRVIAENTLLALEKGLSGLYHLTNSGYASRYEWAKKIAELKGIRKIIHACSKDDFDLPARRPGFSPMDNSRISAELGVKIPVWDEEMEIIIDY
jgi:dTDP-4-dehydrorhamnose reductase